MRYVMVVEVDDELLDGDDSIGNAVSEVRNTLARARGSLSAHSGVWWDRMPIAVRPLSEVISC